MYRPPYANGSYPSFSQQSWYPTAADVAQPGGGMPSSIHGNDSRPYSPQPPSEIFIALRNKSTEELQKLLSDQEAYNAFLHSLESVKQIDSVWRELLNRNVELANQNLEKESEIFQLRNQCTIIRTTELAAAQERFNEAHKQEKDIKAVFSPAVLLERLHDAASKVDEESDVLYHQLLSGEIALPEFLQNYKKKRYLYHKRTLTRLAAKTSMNLPG